MSFAPIAPTPVHHAIIRSGRLTFRTEQSQRSLLRTATPDIRQLPTNYYSNSTMKIIATSIVVLAASATVSAGESNLRLGRELRGLKGLAYGARCCKGRDPCNVTFESDQARDDFIDAGECGDLSTLRTKLADKFNAGFFGCYVNDDGDCDAIEEPDDRRRDLKKGNRPINDKAMGYGRRCCRGFDEGTEEGQCESGLTYDEACEYSDIPEGLRLDKFIEGFNAGGCVWNSEPDSDGEPEGCEFASAE